MAVKYLVSVDGKDHLPVTGSDGKPDHGLMGDAWAALHGDYRGNPYQGPNKQAAIAKLTAMYKSEGMDTPGTSSTSHGEGLKDWFEVFRAGDYGDKGKYTPEDLQHVADSYNPDFHEAPAVIGHPANDLPAYGWVRGLKHDSGKLFAKLGEDTDPQFEDAVQRGAFKKRSVSFYHKPEGLELRHIGFLGALPPEVKGLAAIKFEDGFETAEVVFQEGSMAVNEKPLGEQIRDGLKEFFAPVFGGARSQQAAATTFSEEDLQKMITASLAPVLRKNEELETKLAKQATEFAERERKIVTGEHSGRVADAVNKLRSAGKWIPAFEKMGLKAVFSELAKNAMHVYTLNWGSLRSNAKVHADIKRLKQWAEQFRDGFFTIIDWDDISTDSGLPRQHVGRFLDPIEPIEVANLWWSAQGVRFIEIPDVPMVNYPDDWTGDSIWHFTLNDFGELRPSVDDPDNWTLVQDPYSAMSVKYGSTKGYDLQSVGGCSSGGGGGPM